MTPVCLVIPPSVFLLDERVFMNLGILKVAAALEARSVPVEVLDLSGIENYEDVVRLHTARSAAVHFGITATTPQMPAATRIAGAIRRVRPDATLILGGPHVTLVSAAQKQEQKRGGHGRASRAMELLEQRFDVLVAGDGEEAIFLAIGRDAPRFIDADDPKSSLFLNNAALTAMPFPARHLVDVDSYRYFIEGERALSLIAQLGCPFECGFCGGRVSPMLRRVRMRSTESIVSEMVFLHERYGVTGFMFYDDELNVNPQMVSLMDAIAQAQVRVGVSWRLRGFIKAQLFNERQAAVMYAAGFRWILVGFESGSPRILTNINKRSTLEENTRCINIAKQHGLKVKALMSIGHPGESRDTVMDTHRWLLDVKPSDFDVTIITTYPGTPYYDEAIPDASRSGVWVYTYQKTGDRLFGIEVDYTQVAEYYKGDPDGGYRSFVFTDRLTSDALVELRDFVERDVRAQLQIPFNAPAAVRYEHSMGQTGGSLPPYILKAARQEERTPGRLARLTIRLESI